MTRHHSCRVSPFGHPRIHARLAAPRGLSQPPTSFIGSQCQGIHHAPLNTYKHKTNYKKFEIAHQRTTTTPHPTPRKVTRPKAHGCRSLDARNHYPQIKHHTPPPKTGRQPTLFPRRETTTGLLPQSPIVCPVIPFPGRRTDPNPRKTFVVHQNRRHYSARPIHRIARETTPRDLREALESRGAP